MNTEQDRAAQRVYKIVTRPQAHPIGTTGVDATGNQLIREEDGWYTLNEDTDVEVGPLSVTDLTYPIRVRRHKAGPTRDDRRAEARFKGKRVKAFRQAQAEVERDAQ